MRLIIKAKNSQNDKQKDEQTITYILDRCILFDYDVLFGLNATLYHFLFLNTV